MDSFFTGKGFKAAKCKTLLKLTIPRIKLLRNRREIQLKQMRREIAKLLETGQEATAHIRVEHIIREEKMMAAQEIVELFAELISVRLPIIETQRECPLDLKEAISSVCFAAPRCADLIELHQVQMLFAAKYGKEFVAAATELRPECGVNRKLVELLSVRAPDPEVKLKLLKDIAEEHDLDWDPTASESELLKPHEDLLNGPTQFVSGSKLLLTEEKHYEPTYAGSKQSPTAESNSDDDMETMDFPEVPKASVRPTVDTVSAPEMLPFPAAGFESTNSNDTNETIARESEFVLPHKGLNEVKSVATQSEPDLEPHKVQEEMSPVAKQSDTTKVSAASDESNKQFVPFISRPLPSMTSLVKERDAPHPLLRSRSDFNADFNADLQDVLAAAHAAADSAERAATAARLAASLAQVRISELVKKRSNEIPRGSSDNPFHEDSHEPNTAGKPQISRNDSSGENAVSVADSSGWNQDCKAHFPPQLSPLPSFDDDKVDISSSYDDQKVEFEPKNDFTELPHQCQRLPSLEDEFYSYPNLFKRQDSNIEPGTRGTGGSSNSTN